MSVGLFLWLTCVFEKRSSSSSLCVRGCIMHPFPRRCIGHSGYRCDMKNKGNLPQRLEGPLHFFNWHIFFVVLCPLSDPWPCRWSSHPSCHSRNGSWAMRVHFHRVAFLVEWSFSFSLSALRHVVIAQKCSPWRVFTAYSGVLLLVMFLIAYCCVLLLVDISSGWL